MFFGVNPFYNGVLYSLRKRGLSLLRLAKDHKLRLTWFRKLGLVEPPNSDNVRVCVNVVYTSQGFFFHFRYASCYEIKRTKRGITKDTVPNLLSFNK